MFILLSFSIKEYLAYGIPSTIMIMLEVWCYEAFVFLSGCIGIEYQSAAVTLINFLSVIYNIAIGMGIAAVNLVGSSIGAYNPNGAEKYAKVSIALSLIIIFWIIHGCIQTKNYNIYLNILYIFHLLKYSVQRFFLYMYLILRYNIFIFSWVKDGAIVPGQVELSGPSTLVRYSYPH